MKKQYEKYTLNECNFFRIRNRNEVRVIRCIKEVLEKLGNPELPEKTLCDVYAYALNNLPPRYAQTGSIILRDPVKKATIEKAVEEALHRVLKNPKK